MPQDLVYSAGSLVSGERTLRTQLRTQTWKPDYPRFKSQLCYLLAV